MSAAAGDSGGETCGRQGAESVGDRAEHLAHDALAAARGVADTGSVTVLLELLAGLSIAEGDCAEAVRIFGAAQATREEREDLTRYPPSATWYAKDLEAARDALGAEAFAVLWAEGAAMSCRAAVDYARRGRSTRKRPASGWASLTPAEEQAVAVVAEGLSNVHRRPSSVDRPGTSPSPKGS